ncbi:pyridoxal phosphate-dependent aminotransferase [Candidatus Bipolaricaulota bacterium]
MDQAKEIDLSYADLRCPPPDSLIQALRHELEMINLYPPAGYHQLRECIASYAGVSCSHVMAGNGGDELIDLATRVWGDHVLIPVPTFGQYLEAAQRDERNITLTPCLDRGSYVVHFSQDDLAEASLVWICNPNNPTGTRVPRETILSVVESSHGIVVVDECYYEFLGETVVDLVDRYSNLVVLRSFSKSFGLAGLRLGYAIASPPKIDQLEAKRQIFSVNRLAASAGCLSIAHSTYYENAREQVATTRDAFVHSLQELGLLVFDSYTNFVLVSFEEQDQYDAIEEALDAARIKPLSACSSEFSGLDGLFLRFTIGTSADMEKVSLVFLEVLGSGGAS